MNERDPWRQLTPEEIHQDIRAGFAAMHAASCHLCPGPCVLPDCPHALDQPWRPGTEEEELGAAHELIGEDDE